MKDARIQPGWSCYLLSCKLQDLLMILVMVRYIQALPGFFRKKTLCSEQTMPYSWLSAVGLFLVILTVTQAGCGRKTAPLPPQLVVPEAIADLSVVLDSEGATLGWSYPARSTSGEHLEEIGEFEVYRAIVRDSEYCSGCLLTFGEPRSIPGGKIPLGSFGRKAVFTESALRPGFRYFYRVRSRAAWHFPSTPSNIVSFVWKTPPGPPIDVKILDGDRDVTLSWQEPLTALDGMRIKEKLFYQSYKRSSPKEGWKAIGSLLDKPAMTDYDVIYGKRYFYMVKALRLSDGKYIAGRPSAEVSVVLKDLVPPPPPQRLSYTEGVLSWQPVSSNDLQGYNLYRRCGDQSGKMITAGVSQKTFLKPQAGCFYWVTSVDATGNESPPSQEIFIKVP